METPEEKALFEAGEGGDLQFCISYVTLLCFVSCRFETFALLLLIFFLLSFWVNKNIYDDFPDFLPASNYIFMFTFLKAIYGVIILNLITIVMNINKK